MLTSLPGRRSSDKSVALRYMTGNALTMENNGNWRSVRNASHHRSVQLGRQLIDGLQRFEESCKCIAADDGSAMGKTG